MKKPIPFGKYYLLERVNVGGMAEVFKAKAFGVEGFERMLAVKRILPNIAEDEEFITMFIDEAKISVQLNHANIAQIFDLGKVDDSYFIALEYIHGKDLRAIFDRCRASGENMPIAQACFITMKTCEGLDYAHNKRDAAGRELGLVHRDISPQNVLISYEGEVKLIDFGIAKAAGKASKTQAGILKGKFGYMSPEQVRGIPLDRRSDIFSVGIVLYELLTGERLFIGESDFSTLEKVRNVEILPPSTYNRKIPEELERIVLKALAKDTEDRYGNAIDLHDELQAFMYTAGEFYSRKDLAVWMKGTFGRELEEETAKLEEYRTLAPPAPAAGYDADSDYDVGYGQAANVSSAEAYDDADLDWDDEEIETQLYDNPPTGVDADEEVYEPVGGGLPGPVGYQKDYHNAGLPSPAPAYDQEEEVDPFEAAAFAKPQPDPFDLPPAQPEPMPAHTPPTMAAPHPVAHQPQPVQRADLAPRHAAPRPSSGGGMKTFGIIMAVILILGGAAAAVYFLVLKKDKTGTLKIRVTQAGAIITIDNGKTEYKSPLTIKLAAGPHVISIRKAGFEPKVRDIEIKAGQTTEMELSLKQATVAKGAFQVLSQPAGADVELDGKPLPRQTDIKVEVSVGSHTLRIKKKNYHPWPTAGVHNFEVKQGIESKILARLIPERVQLVISSNAKRGSAKFVLYKNDDREQSGSVPKTITVKQVDPKASYRIEIRAKGYDKWSKKLVFQGSDEVRVHAPFASASVADKPKTMDRPSMDPDPEPPRPRYVPRYRPRPMYRPPPMRVTPPPMASGAYGFLRINTKPWTKVYVDGRLRGTTPLLKLKLSAGRHRLVLLNNNFSIRKAYWVTIRPKAFTTFIRDLRK